MMIVLPEWYTKARKKLDDCIDDIISKNQIDWTFSHDSASIKDSKEDILMTLVRIYESVDVEERERLRKFEKDMKKSLRKDKIK
ncbi:unnamed protein product, partial [marine sediment metagenome]